MSKQRMINTRFWVDDYISNLDPIEKLLFLYFLTNPATDICGIYELPIKNIALDTGLDKEMVIKVFDRFSKDGRIFYKNGWVIIKNFAKHQSMNPSVKKGIEVGLSKVPKEIIDILSTDSDRLRQPVTGSDSPVHLNLNSNLNSNLKIERLSPTPAQEATDFFGGNFEPILQEFIINTVISPEILRQEFSKFILYWTEKNKTGKKQKWELEKTFEIRRRIVTWLGNVKQFSKVEFNKGRGLA